MSDLISRRDVNRLIDELARAISDEKCHIQRGRNYGRIMRDILELPSVEPERKTGKWHIEGFNVWCTSCGFHPKEIEVFDYCPSCGAKMEVDG